MKKFMLILLLTIPFFSFSQELEFNANYIKTKFPSDYTNTIRKHAVEEWGTDHQMIVYTINKQADALVSLIKDFKSENTRILYDAIKEWSFDGYESSNIQKFNALNLISVENLVKLHCDWGMVKYVYDKQEKAKAAY